MVCTSEGNKEPLRQATNLHFDNAVDGFVGSINRASAHACASLHLSVRAHQAHCGSGQAHGAAHHLKVQQVPQSGRLVHLVCDEGQQVIIIDRLLLVCHILQFTPMRCDGAML